jgi:ABC-type polysaccharide/polyol phosphate export permease
MEQRSAPAVAPTPGGRSSPALADVARAAGRPDVWLLLAWHDVRQRFRRSVLGPLWITLAMAAMIITLALVLGAILSQPVADILPYVGVGLIFWGLFSTTISESTTVFVEAAAIVRNVPMPLAANVFRVLARNAIIWLFNMIIFVALAVVLLPLPGPEIVLFLPGLLLFVLNLAWMSATIAVLSARYRDIPQLVVSIMQVLFFLTPVFWSPERLPSRPAFVTFNPLAHLFEIVRAPLLGAAPSAFSWAVSSLLAALGLVLAAVLYRRAHARIPFWI